MRQVYWDFVYYLSTVIWFNYADGFFFNHQISILFMLENNLICYSTTGLQSLKFHHKIVLIVILHQLCILLGFSSRPQHGSWLVSLFDLGSKSLIFKELVHKYEEWQLIHRSRVLKILLLIGIPNFFFFPERCIVFVLCFLRQCMLVPPFLLGWKVQVKQWKPWIR